MTKSLVDKAVTEDQLSETPVSRALKRRKQLQDEIKTSIKELEKIEEFLKMYRSLSGDNDGAVVSKLRYILGGAGTGRTQAFFEQLVRTVLLDAGRPMRSPEIIEAFNKRGHSIGGNEIRTAWNRLWQAKKNKVLINIPSYGYWLADEPLPEKALSQPPPKRMLTGLSIQQRGSGRRVGRQPMLTEGQIKNSGRLARRGKEDPERDSARSWGNFSRNGRELSLGATQKAGGSDASRGA